MQVCFTSLDTATHEVYLKYVGNWTVKTTIVLPTTGEKKISHRPQVYSSTEMKRSSGSSPNKEVIAQISHCLQLRHAWLAFNQFPWFLKTEEEVNLPLLRTSLHSWHTFIQHIHTAEQLYKKAAFEGKLSGHASSSPTSETQKSCQPILMGDKMGGGFIKKQAQINHIYTERHLTNRLQ